MHNKKGFALLTVFLLLTMITFSVTQFTRKGTVFASFMDVALKKEQAKQLALTGVSLALNQLMLYDEKDEQQEEKKEEGVSPELLRSKKLLHYLLINHNKWQTIKLIEETDGIEGEVTFCISCEDGKIPLKPLFDYQKKEFIKKEQPAFDAERFLQLVFQKIAPFMKGKNLFEPFMQWMQQQEYTLIDSTDLLRIKEFSEHKDAVFYTPQKEVTNRKVFLSDLFTTWTDSLTINPLLFSHSVQTAFNFNGARDGSISEDDAQEIVDKIDLQHFSWQVDWPQSLEAVYNREYQELPEDLKAILSLKFEPQLFSVVCYGKLHSISQKLLVIIKRSFSQEGELFEVKRIYWL